jgi:hypothetical protein
LLLQMEKRGPKSSGRPAHEADRPRGSSSSGTPGAGTAAAASGAVATPSAAPSHPWLPSARLCRPQTTSSAVDGRASSAAAGLAHGSQAGSRSGVLQAGTLSYDASYASHCPCDFETPPWVFRYPETAPAIGSSDGDRSGGASLSPRRVLSPLSPILAAAFACGRPVGGTARLVSS